MTFVSRDSSASRLHVVIVGTGSGGLTAAKRLAKAAVEVTLIDCENHHLFQPLLYQIVTAHLSRRRSHGRSGVYSDGNAILVSCSARSLASIANDTL